MKILLFILFLPITLPIWLIAKLIKLCNSTVVPRCYDISQVDGMTDGHQFEHYVAEILTQNGYKGVQVTQASGDYGVDVIAFDGKDKYAIQCKLYSKSVGNSAVQEVVAGKAHYGCNVGVVVTNNFFTNNATVLAKSNGIILWDRNGLIRLIDKANKNQVTASPPVEPEIARHSEHKEYSEPTQNLDVDKIKMSIINSKKSETETPIIKHDEVYLFPSTDLFDSSKLGFDSEMSEELKDIGITTSNFFGDIGVKVIIEDIYTNLSITQLRCKFEEGINLSKIIALSAELSFYLSVPSVRIFPMWQDSSICIEVPLKRRKPTPIKWVIEAKEFSESSISSFALGWKSGASFIMFDFTEFYNLLVYGGTDSEINMLINSMIVSMLFKAPPDEIKLIVADTKLVELTQFNGIPHMLVPVITEINKFVGALAWLESEISSRYTLFSESKVRNISDYNAAEKNTPNLSNVIVIINELSLIPNNLAIQIKESLLRMIQRSHITGVYFLIATASYSNFIADEISEIGSVSKILLSVQNKKSAFLDYDFGGRRKLLGDGDMFFIPSGSKDISRIQGCSISDGEIKNVVEFLKHENPDFVEKNYISDNKNGASDEMLIPAIECVIDSGMASTSLIQRRLNLGYARSARLMDEMESAGIVGPFEGSKPRVVLISREKWEEIKSNV